MKTGTEDRPVGPAEKGQEQLTPKLIPTAFSGYDGPAVIGNEQDNFQETDDTANYQNNKRLGNENDRLATVGMCTNSRSEVIENGGGNGNRTRDLLHAMQALSRTELCPHQGQTVKPNSSGIQEVFVSLSSLKACENTANEQRCQENPPASEGQVERGCGGEK